MPPAAKLSASGVLSLNSAFVASALPNSTSTLEPTVDGECKVNGGTGLAGWRLTLSGCQGDDEWFLLGYKAIHLTYLDVRKRRTIGGVLCRREEIQPNNQHEVGNIQPVYHQCYALVKLPKCLPPQGVFIFWLDLHLHFFRFSSSFSPFIQTSPSVTNIHSSPQLTASVFPIEHYELVVERPSS